MQHTTVKLMAGLLSLLCAGAYAGSKIDISIDNTSDQTIIISKADHFCTDIPFKKITIPPKSKKVLRAEEDSGFFNGCKFKHSAMAINIQKNGSENYRVHFVDALGAVRKANRYMNEGFQGQGNLQMNMVYSKYGKANLSPLALAIGTNAPTLMINMPKEGRITLGGSSSGFRDIHISFSVH